MALAKIDWLRTFSDEPKLRRGRLEYRAPGFSLWNFRYRATLHFGRDSGHRNLRHAISRSGSSRSGSPPHRVAEFTGATCQFAARESSPYFAAPRGAKMVAAEKFTLASARAILGRNWQR